MTKYCTPETAEGCVTAVYDGCKATWVGMLLPSDHPWLIIQSFIGCSVVAWHMTIVNTIELPYYNIQLPHDS